jgi:predicted NBD/HSP70 family sugar kinase
MLIAVDTGGTKTLVASFSQDGTMTASVKFPTPKSTDTYLHQLHAAVMSLTTDTVPSALVVGVPGIVKDGIAIWCNHLGWKNFPIQEQLTTFFPDTPILIENDANLAGLAEARSLSPVPRSALYITISTGIGSGMITDGKIDPGLRLSEAGRAMVEFDGMVREWESFASGSAIVKSYGKYARDITSKRVWNQIADRISRGFLILVPIIQPDIIIIGGSLGTYFAQYHDQLQALLIEKLPAHIPPPPIVQASHPEQAVIYGCYYYALDSLTS